MTASEAIATARRLGVYDLNGQALIRSLIADRDRAQARVAELETARDLRRTDYNATKAKLAAVKEALDELDRPPRSGTYLTYRDGREAAVRTIRKALA